VALSKQKKNIKAVTFDLWETLLLETDGANSRRFDARCKSLHQALDRLGIKISVARIESALKQTILTLVNVWETNKDVKHEDQIRLLIESASNGSIALREEWIGDLTSAYIKPVFTVPPYLNPDTHKVLHWLKNRKKLIGLICNTGLTAGIGLRRLLEKEKVAQYFDLMLFSEEIGIRKPDPRIFHLVAETLGISPCEAVHIGDNLKSDIWGAQKAGFRAIHLSSEEGRDKLAKSDPSSLVSLSRRLGGLEKARIIPDKTITSLEMAVNAIEELETS
jgi:putative hydrolase of the HAD superfamily